MNERLTTRGLAELLAHQTGLDSQRAEKFIDALSSYISQGIERNKVVKILGLGTFKIVLVRERESVHIQTGERFVIPAHHKLSFVPDKDFKEQINRPFAFFEPVEAIDGDMPEATENVQATEDKKPKKVSFKKDVAIDEVVAVPTVVTPEPETSITDAEIENLPVKEPLDVADDPIVPDEYEVVYPDDEYDITEQEQEQEIETAIEPDTVYDFSEIEEYPEEVTEKYQEEIIEEQEVEEEVYTDTDKEEVSNEYDAPVAEEKKKRTAPLWLWFLLLPLLFLAGVGIGTYAFLYYTSDRALKTEQLLISGTNQKTIENTPLPIGVIPATDIKETEEDRMLESADGVLTDETADSPLPEDANKNIENSSTAETAETADKKEDKAVIDWLAPSPENPNPKTETKRADKPNREIEERNKNLTDKNKANAKATTASSGNAKTTNSNTAKAGNTTTTAANRTKAMPSKVRMTAGSSLTQIAMEYYGDKIFWVYIYEHNKSRIKNFDNIPVGTELRLPSPKTYGINAKSDASVKKARQKQSELMKWDNWDDYR